MPKIEIVTEINAEIQLVFDLSRSIDLYIISTEKTKEKAIAGKTEGLIELGEQVTWQARHFGVAQKFTSKIIEFEPPFLFVDQMQKGIFKSFRHEHHFKVISEEKTLVKDILAYEAPLKILGKLADFLFLKKYLKDFLAERNKIIKAYAENGEGSAFLQEY
ncbi:hypothetical protein SAMN04487907_10134 [Zunongwangia mangrovi]|uniref:Ligand-binding SRPBCC domain-containing protein n=1 Tax=Zunongwangia mangrovi TaxID=1334022 RepID=A0A1I1D212_9FLAO|nr:SRPBCC family protein [Zunongwangia mangrovi]SFB68402.1 hypothetical protein SAMN04487907_10134 [Zunongwangia mangrovi]